MLNEVFCSFQVLEMLLVAAKDISSFLSKQVYNILSKNANSEKIMQKVTTNPKIRPKNEKIMQKVTTDRGAFRGF